MASQKGPQFERDLIPWLRVIWPHVRRSGKGFSGADFLNTGPFSIEAKNRKDLRLAEWMKQATLDAEQSGAKYPVVMHKRRFFGTHGAYVTMSVETFIRILAEAAGVDIPEDLVPLTDDTHDRPDWA